MDDHSVTFMDSLPSEVADIVSRGHVDYEAGHGILCGFKGFAIVAQNRFGAPLGVLSGYTAYAEVYVDDLWVDADYRKRGLGRKMLQALEDRFKGLGFDNINCVTNQFQAVGFYTKCGFDIEFVRPNKHNPKLTKTFLIKYLDEDNPI